MDVMEAIQIADAKARACYNALAAARFPATVKVYEELDDCMRAISKLHAFLVDEGLVSRWD